MATGLAQHVVRVHAWIRSVVRGRGVPAPPLNPLSAAYWDEKWSKSIANKRFLPSDRVPDPRSAFLDLVEWFDEPRWRRVLIVGCGISTEPAMLAHLGYEVVAIDVSEVAISHLSSHPVTRDELAAWLRLRRPPGSEENRLLDHHESLALVDDARREADSLKLVCADFRSFEADAPFDVIYCPRSWQCLDADGKRELVSRRAFIWLAPGGACRVLTQNLKEDASRELHDLFLSAGFFRRDESAHAYREITPRLVHSWDRHNELSREDDARAKERLASGEKMFDVYNASG